GNSHWVVPAALISWIELVELPSQQNLIKITFSGAQNEEMVTFSLTKQAALSLATALSARTGKIIHFKGAGADAEPPPIASFTTFFPVLRAIPVDRATSRISSPANHRRSTCSMSIVLCSAAATDYCAATGPDHRLQPALAGVRPHADHFHLQLPLQLLFLRLSVLQLLPVLQLSVLCRPGIWIWLWLRVPLTALRQQTRRDKQTCRSQ